MLKNYIKTALRNLRRNQLYAILNIAGLALGISCATVVFKYVLHENQFGADQENFDRVYRVTRVENYPDGVQYGRGTPHPMADALREEYPELAAVTHVNYIEGGQVNVKDESGTLHKYLIDEGITFAENEFFQIFTVDWVAGNPESALSDINEVVLSETAVTKYLNLPKDQTGLALGKIINLENKRDFKVVGVVKDSPKNSYFPFDFYFSYEGQKEINPYFQEGKSWNTTSSNTNTFFLLKEGTDVENISSSIQNIKDKFKPNDKTLEYYVQPFSEMRFDERFGSYVGTISADLLIAFTIIGIFLVITACINFVNLATAQAANRAKEIGIRKAIGGMSQQLVVQFLAEIAVITFLSLLFSLAISELLFIYLERVIDVRLSLDLLSDPYTISFLVAVFILVTILSGLYPSLLLSRMNAVVALKSKLAASKHSGGLSIRKGLVIVQFAISQFLIIGTIIVIQQMDYFQRKDLGFEKDAIITSYLPERNVAKNRLFRQKLTEHPAISGVMYGLSTPIGNADSHSNFNYAPLESENDFQGNFKAVDEGYEEFFGIDILAGRNIQKRDSTSATVINRKVAELMGFGDDFNQAIGKTINTGWGGDKKIVGVIENFHTYKLSEALDYVFMIYFPDAFYNVSIKTPSLAVADEAISHFRKTWEEVYPDYVVEYSFLDEVIAEQYEQEQTYGMLIKLFSGISIFIGCLGLYGLIAFIANNKIKEIGIRKVLGASVLSILGMFTKEILWLVLIAFVIAVPAAYYLLDNWLNNYEFRIDLGAGIFALAFFVTFLISLITISHRTISSATINPAKTLKDE